MATYRNAAQGFLSELEGIVTKGEIVSVRNSVTRERRTRLIHIEKPHERCIVLPHRHNDVVAAAAETVWVLAGRNDLAFLRHYLPRADSFSDDGSTWRAGYGPRLRAWNGVDQVAEVLKKLETDPASRQAVISLFDPAEDYQVSKDIPCTNWLHFTLRNGSLDLTITIRSNDIWWGFSGINLFEWSTLHEMMAYWLGARVGTLHYFVSSLHLYERHFERGARVLENRSFTGPYQRGWSNVPFASQWRAMPELLDRWFQTEADLRSGIDRSQAAIKFPDPLMRQYLLAVRVKWTAEHGGSETDIQAAIADLGSTDTAFALLEQYSRRKNGGGLGPIHAEFAAAPENLS